MATVCTGLYFAMGEDKLTLFKYNIYLHCRHVKAPKYTARLSFNGAKVDTHLNFKLCFKLNPVPYIPHCRETFYMRNLSREEVFSSCVKKKMIYRTQFSGDPNNKKDYKHQEEIMLNFN